MHMTAAQHAPTMPARPDLRGCTRVDATQDGELELLRRIARDRDHAAFQELYGHFSKAAFNLALHLTRDANLAEEAVQDGMVRIWRFAGQCSEGSARSWVLRIVANESLRLLKRKRNRNVVMTSDEAERLPAREVKSKGGAEREELQEALHRGIECLPDHTRQIVALYYGANLSQREIGEMLEVPQTTVSLRLREALDNLRTALAGAGFAAAVPMLESGALKDVLLGGAQAPPDLLSKIVGQLENAARITQRFSRRLAPATPKGKVFATVAFCAAAAASSAWWYAHSQSASPESAALPATSAAPAERIYRVWDFTKGPDANLRASHGAWDWVPAADGRPAGMQSSMEGSVRTRVSLPLEVPPGRCWKIRIRGYLHLTKLGDRFEADVSQALRLPPKAYTLYRSANPELTQGRFETVTYLIPDKWEMYTYRIREDGKVFAISFMHHEPESELMPTFILITRHCIVENVELLEIGPEDVPEPYNDPEHAIKNFKLKASRYFRTNYPSPQELEEMRKASE